MLGGWAIAERHRLVVKLVALGGVPDLLPASEEGPEVRWYDDYFTVQAIDDRTFVIGEPRYYQQVFSYLIVGTERALLFDAGPGLRDVRAVAESLTSLPITFLPSHLHYDHVGNRVTFSRVAMVDLPHLRARSRDDRLPLLWSEHLGEAEGFGTPTFEVSEWWAPGSIISLGQRDLLLIHTPGHTEESVSLVDQDAGLVFAGDFIYPGPLFAMLPNSSLGDYLFGTEELLQLELGTARVFAAHRLEGPGAPSVGMEDVRDLRRTLLAIQAGKAESTGLYPVEVPVNAEIQLFIEPAWLQRWADGPRAP